MIRVDIVWFRSFSGIADVAQPKSGSLQHRRPTEFVVRPRKIRSIVGIKSPAFRWKLRSEFYRFH